MKKFLVSRRDSRRIEFASAIRNPVAIYEGDRPSCFDKSYSLSSLYDDATFFDALAAVNGEVSLVLWDVGKSIHSEDPAYLKSYTKIKPLSLQAGEVYVVDRLAFYYSSKSVLRPFFYIHGDVFSETLQEFYGVGVYADYDGNTIEKSADRIRPYVEMDAGEILIQVVEVRPTAKEVSGYEELKYRLIMVEKKPKSSIVNQLFKYIDAMESKSQALRDCVLDGVKIESNDFRRLQKNYDLILDGSDRAVFFSTGFGLDSMGLERTLSAIRDHNELVRCLRGS